MNTFLLLFSIKEVHCFHVIQIWIDKRFGPLSLFSLPDFYSVDGREERVDERRRLQASADHRERTAPWRRHDVWCWLVNGFFCLLQVKTVWVTAAPERHPFLMLSMRIIEVQLVFWCLLLFFFNIVQEGVVSINQKNHSNQADSQSLHSESEVPQRKHNQQRIVRKDSGDYSSRSGI